MQIMFMLQLCTVKFRNFTFVLQKHVMQMQLVKFVDKETEGKYGDGQNKGNKGNMMKEENSLL